MKVLHVIPSLSPSQGGPSFAMPLIERALAAEGIHVTTVSTDNGDANHGDSQSCGESSAKRICFRRQTEFYKCSFPLWRWLKKHVHEYDLVHVHALFSFSSIAAARCARRRGVPCIIRPLGVLNHYGMTQRRPWLKRLSFRFVEGPLLNCAAAVHYTSRQEQLEAEALGIRAKAAIIPLGIDTRSFEKTPGPDLFLKRFPQAAGRSVVLFLSRIEPKKGLEFLLPAFAKLRGNKSNAFLAIAGGTSAGENYRSVLMKQSSSLGLNGSLLWAGHLSGDEKMSALAAATVFVLPSHSENFGLAVVEALASGVSSITTPGVAVSQDIHEANAGLVVPLEVDSLASSMEKLLNDGALRQTFSQNARKLVQEKFSLHAMGSNLAALYKIVLNTHKTRNTGPYN